MVDRIVESDDIEVPEIPETLEKVLLFALDEAKQKLVGGADIVPFTALAIKENLFIETHPGDDSEECFAAAKHTVEGARGADAYALCYDGFIDTDEGDLDAIIAEGGIPGEDAGYAICYLYEIDEEGKIDFEDEPAYIGEAPNFMMFLKNASEYADDEIDEKYMEEDVAEEL
ncbi:MAG: hypothetical protein IKV48_06680 [Eggerthellaceae bacterium]|nr:hypothetical protein [Eggerthellaceae bacterium]